MNNGFTQQEWNDIKAFARHFLDCTRWVETQSPDPYGDELRRKREFAKKVIR